MLYICLIFQMIGGVSKKNKIIEKEVSAEGKKYF